MVKGRRFSIKLTINYLVVAVFMQRGMYTKIKMYPWMCKKSLVHHRSYRRVTIINKTRPQKINKLKR